MLREQLAFTGCLLHQADEAEQYYRSSWLRPWKQQPPALVGRVLDLSSLGPPPIDVGAPVVPAGAIFPQPSTAAGANQCSFASGIPRAVKRGGSFIATVADLPQPSVYVRHLYVCNPLCVSQKKRPVLHHGDQGSCGNHQRHPFVACRLKRQSCMSLSCIEVLLSTAIVKHEWSHSCNPFVPTMAEVCQFCGADLGRRLAPR